MNFLKNKLKDFNFGAWVDLNVTNLGFIGASIVSALINVSFIGNLTKDRISLGLFVVKGVVLMTAISLVLEMAKLLHVTKVNTLGELQRKLKGTSAEKKIKRVKVKWFLGYLFYTLIAIAAAVNFSLGNLGRESKKVDSEIASLEAQYSETQRLEEKIINLKSQIQTLDNSLDDETELNKLWIEYTEINKIRNVAFDKANEQEVGVDTIPEYKEFREKAVDFCNKIGIAQITGRNFTTRFNKDSLAEELNKRTLKRKAKASAELKEVEERLKATLKEYSNSYEIGLKLEDTKTKKITEAGSQAGIEIFSNILGISSDVFKTFFILMLSLAVELTIFQCAPTVRITRKMLYRFLRYLPSDFDVNEFMDRVEKEMVDFSVLDITNKDQSELTREEIEIEKAKKRVEKKSLEREEKTLIEEINKNSLIEDQKETIAVKENEDHPIYNNFKGWKKEAENSKKEAAPKTSTLSKPSQENVQYTPEGFIVGVKKPKIEVEKKKRGRPSKKREGGVFESSPEVQPKNQTEEMQMEKPTKRRGRPPKDKAEKQNEEAKEAVNTSAPKKRGRPPKYTEEQRKEVEKQRREEYALAKQAENLAKASAAVSNPVETTSPSSTELKNYEEEAKKFENPDQEESNTPAEVNAAPSSIPDKPFVEEDPKEIKVYAFGRTTKEVALKMEELLENVYRVAEKDPNYGLVVDFDQIKRRTTLKPRAFEILWSSLFNVPGFLSMLGEGKYQLTRSNLQEAKNLVLQEKGK